jgi:CRP-like cAMP-binding protein
MTPDDHARVVNFLSQLPLFNELDSVELEQIAKTATELRVPRGEVIFKRGDPCVGFHTVVYGRVKLAFHSPQGLEKVVELIGPGHSFGEALMFMGKPYILTAQTIEDSMLLHISSEAIFGELERNPKFARKMLAGLSRRLHSLISDVEAFSLNSGTQRVIGYLLKEAHPENGEPIVLQATKAVVASRLSLTPEHFSRILHDLAEKGMISVNGRDVMILDLAKLKAYEK